MKHFQYYFVLRQKPETFEERNQELHSTVRTSDLGTTLRLLASGADPNFFHPVWNLLFSYLIYFETS